jgi:hypothetical protein
VLFAFWQNREATTTAKKKASSGKGWDPQEEIEGYNKSEKQRVVGNEVTQKKKKKSGSFLKEQKKK